MGCPFTCLSFCQPVYLRSKYFKNEWSDSAEIWTLVLNWYTDDHASVWWKKTYRRHVSIMSNTMFLGLLMHHFIRQCKKKSFWFKIVRYGVGGIRFLIRALEEAMPGTFGETLRVNQKDITKYFLKKCPQHWLISTSVLAQIPAKTDVYLRDFIVCHTFESFPLNTGKSGNCAFLHCSALSRL